MKVGKCIASALRPGTTVIGLLSVAVATAMVQVLVVVVVVVEARKIPNRAVEGLTHSGYFFPKLFLFHQLRTSPGRYWLAYGTWAIGFSMRSLWVWKSEGPEDHYNLYRSVARIADVIAGMTVVIIAVVTDNIAEVSVIYLGGLCYIQTFIEAMRADGMTANSNRYNCVAKAFTLWGVSWALTCASALLCNLRHLNHVNAAYTVVNFVLIAPLAAMSNYCGEGEKDDTIVSNFWKLCRTIFGRKKIDIHGKVRKAYSMGLRRLWGTVASVVQLAFCSAALWVTYKIDDVPRAVTITFFATAAVFAICSNVVHYFTWIYS